MTAHGDVGLSLNCRLNACNTFDIDLQPMFATQTAL